MFSWSLFNELCNDALLVNVDESSFNRSVKSNYSWLPANRSSGIINGNANGRTSMLCALLSNGSWIWLLVDDTVTAQDFGLFLLLLNTYIKSNFPTYEERTTLVLDNASIHLTNSTKNIATQFGMKILGLPPYWPHLAPVEFVFGLVKGHIKSSDQNRSIDYSKSSGKRVIASGLQYLTKAKVLKMWRKAIETARETIVDAYERIQRFSESFQSISFFNEEKKEAQ